MKKSIPLLLASFLVVTCIHQACSQKTTSSNSTKTLKESYKNYFPIGVAVGPRSLTGEEGDFIKTQFNSITAENAMKMESLQPREGVFFWQLADSIVNFAVNNGIKVRGHNLCWHEQAPKWFFTDKDGKNVSRDVLLERLRTHIHTVVGRYKGKIYAWDVVNEAIDDNPSNFLRPTKWTEIIGDDFIAKAFEYAHEADPDAKLFYNDYNTERPEKRERVYKLLKQLKDQGVPIDGVGLQAHWSIFEPSEVELRTALERYSSLGLNIEITELDVSVYKWEKERRSLRPGEIFDFTPELEARQAETYKMAFKAFRDYKEAITNVTFWNISDRYSWLDTYPVSGRKNYPLLFNADLKPKKAFWDVVNFK
jgi:endo-1,4-beta-xylanase